MKTAMIGALGALLALLADPVNKTCPVKGTPIKPGITAEYKGKTIGFCCGGCKSQFTANPDAIAAKIPELKAPPAGKPESKNDKPAATGPCEVKKTVKGYYCVKCDRELGPDDVRGTDCKKCETKPEEIELCYKRIPIFTSKCQHKKRDTKPFVCCNKPWGVPTSFEESTARCTYKCEVCGVGGRFEKDVKHKEDCKPKFGNGIVKVCTASGKAPHVGDDK